MGKHRQYGMEMANPEWDPPLPDVAKIELVRYDPWDMYLKCDDDYIAHISSFAGHPSLHFSEMVEAMHTTETIKMLVWHRFTNL